MTTILHPPRPLPLSHLHPPSTIPLPTAANRPTHLVLSAQLVSRTDILRWKPRHLLRGKGNLFPKGFPTARTMMSLRSPRSGGKRSAWRATSVDSVKLLVGNRPKAAWIGHASEPFRLSSTSLHFAPLFWFRDSDSSLPFLVNVRVVEWSAYIHQSPTAGSVAVRVPLPNTPIKCPRMGPSQGKIYACTPYPISSLRFDMLSSHLPHKIAISVFAV